MSESLLMAWLLKQGQVLASLDTADSFFARSKGLLGKPGFEGAMLLRHTRGVHSFGMRFAMDVAFLDSELVVLDVLTLRPLRVTVPRMHTRSVLEAEAGAFERWSLKPGDQLEIQE
jgi:uncharacterized membrane protein (UPF0127 family)